MPHNLSAAKRMRKNEARRLRNKTRSTELKTIRKKLLRAVNDGQKQDADTVYRDMSKHLDQAASTKTIHKNAAARAKSRLALKLNKIAAAAKTGAK